MVFQILQPIRERRITLCKLTSGIIASVVPSTPCKCVCRADQRPFLAKPLFWLPFVACSAELYRLSVCDFDPPLTHRIDDGPGALDG
jgi:hypothetical protein